MRFTHRWVAAFAAAALLAVSACSDQPGPTEGPAPAPQRLITGQGCFVHHAAFSPFRPDGWSKADLTQELNDLGRILYDADGVNGTACVDAAAEVLRVRLKATLDTTPAHFGGFLSGAFVSMIYAAADRIAANGGMTAALDAQVERVEGSFAHTVVGDDCGYQTTDSCMDPHAMSASGYGWMAQYRASRGWSAAAARDSTRYHVSEALRSICIFSGYGRAQLCNGNVDSIRAGTATTLSLNLGYESIHYGFGLMTSIAAAVAGYEASGGTYSFTPDDKVIALALFKEAQLHITRAPHLYVSPCPKPTFVAASGTWVNDSTLTDCGEGNYKPNMYELNRFYTQRIGPPPLPADWYQSNTFDERLFQQGSSANGLFTYGRLAVYKLMALDWWMSPPAHRPSAGSFAPQGTFDLIDAGRMARGWACDRDAPNGSARVVLKAAGLTDSILARADQPSEAGVNSICGGANHRFVVQLPSTWVGKAVTVKTLDYLGAGTPVTLPCGQGPCTVPVPVQPTVSVAWVLPSHASWGPPNTMTAAGYAANGTGNVQLQWRDATINGSWNTVSYQAPVAGDGTWSNTIPVSNYCHDYQVKAIYSGVTSATFPYPGPNSQYCTETVKIIWIQPQTTAGWGTPGALIVAGEAKNAPAGTQVTMQYRDITAGTGWTTRSFAATPDANGIWINDILSANFTHQYQVKVTYDVKTSPSCTYAGASNITWC